MVDVHDGRAWIECQSVEATACAACAQGTGCSWRRASRTDVLETSADQPDGTLVRGQVVELEADAAALLKAAVRLYLPPLAGLVLGPLGLRALGLDVHSIAPLAAAAVGLAGGLLVGRAWTQHLPVFTVRTAS